jgi:predicted phage terminase large subunit-like protein
LDFPCSKYAGRKEGNIEALGVEASLVSKHYDLFLFDDPVNDKNTTTRAYRNKIEKWYKDCLQLRHDPVESRIRLIGTNWHQDDQYCRIRRKEKKHRAKLLDQGKPVVPRYWMYIRRVVETAPDGGREIVGKKNVRPIWPERFPREIIEEIRGETGSYIFSCQYMNDPLPSEDAIFRHDDILIVAFFDIPETVTNFMAVDLAVSEKDESDFTAITVASFDSEGKMYVRQIIREKMMPKRAIDVIWELCQRWQVRRVAIEGTAFQATVISYYKERCADSGWNIPWAEMKRPKASKSARFLAMQPRVERGDFLVEENIAHLEDMLDEMTSFSLDHLPTYDDILDTLADLEQVFYKAPGIEPEPIPMDTFDGYYGSLVEDEDDDEDGDMGYSRLNEYLYSAK